MRIDAHQHFWSLNRGDYGWLTPNMGPLYRDFLPSDLKPHLNEAGLAGTIVVQAAPTVAETEYLLGLAQRYDFIKGVVGWVDMADPSAPMEILRLREQPKFCGIRPMLQDISDVNWILNPNLGTAFEALLANNLTFDALIVPRHLPIILQLVKRHSKLRVVINHGAKPTIGTSAWQPWADDLAAVARYESVFCKLSGLITECTNNQSLEATEPYIQHILHCFGPDRVLFGSDWPVCLLKSSYGSWLSLAVRSIRKAFGSEADRALGRNALDFYRPSIA